MVFMLARRNKDQLVDESTQVLKILKDHGAKRAEELAEILDVPTRYLERPLKILRREKKVLVSGAKRWTYYSIR